VTSVELAEDVDHLLSEAPQFVAVHQRESLEHVTSCCCQLHPLPTLVVTIRRTPDEARRVGAVDELDDRVVTKLERLREFGDHGRIASCMAPYRQQQLVLCGRDSRLPRGLLGESLEDPERVAKACQCPVVTVRQCAGVEHAEQYIVKR